MNRKELAKYPTYGVMVYVTVGNKKLTLEQTQKLVEQAVKKEKALDVKHVGIGGRP